VAVGRAHGPEEEGGNAGGAWRVVPPVLDTEDKTIVPLHLSTRSNIRESLRSKAQQSLIPSRDRAVRGSYCPPVIYMYGNREEEG